MRTLTRRRLASLSLASSAPALLVLALCACEPEPPGPAPPREIEVGVHRVRLVVPEGWQHVDHGREQRFQRGPRQILLADLGPATPGGFAARLREARALFRADQWEDAETLLASIDPRRFFASEARWKSVETNWSRVARVRREPGDDDSQRGAVDEEVARKVEAAYGELLFEVESLQLEGESLQLKVESLPRSDLETVASDALAELGSDSLRSIADTRPMAVSGRPAIRIDTWDRLSHRDRRRYLFVASEGHLLALSMAFGSGAELEAAFEALAASLALPAAQESDAPDESGETTGSGGV